MYYIKKSVVPTYGNGITNFTKNVYKKSEHKNINKSGSKSILPSKMQGFKRNYYPFRK